MWDKDPFELLVDRPIRHAFHLLMRCKVIDCLPLVGPWTDICQLHLREQLFIPISHGRKSDICTGFDHGLSLTVQHDSAIVAIAHAELLTEDNEVAI